ncbi:MAG: transposase domain-containing protein [Saprospiraceae bacterium]|nr:transposase domain-containing protein [Candidatus Vicinibacter proximus]
MENSIRPLALGRKNFLFAGSHESAHRAAIIYSLFGTCKINRINSHEWLKDILSRIKNHPINRIAELLPHNWKSLQE